VEQIPILYDGDCGFCRATLGVLLTWDRRRRFRPVAIQSEEGARLLDGMPAEQRLASAHAVIPGAPGPVSAGAAAAPVLRELPAGEPFAALADRLPRATERGYRWVADHRSSLSRLVPGALKERADALVRERSRPA